MTYEELFKEGYYALEAAKIEEYPLDARILLEAICNTCRIDLLLHGDREVSEEQIQQYRMWIEKRSARIPLQYILQVQEFMGLEFKVNEHVLIPRQDTEILVETVLKDIYDGSRILDMCTGSGCILISLLKYSNDCIGLGVDISEKALEIARINGEILLGSKMDRTQWSFLSSDLFEKVEDEFDIIVSNPPYIKTQVIDTLMEEVRLHEPITALDGKEDGLYFYRHIIEQSKGFLKKGGSIYFEIGYDQGQEVRELLIESGFTDIKIIKDYAGLDRVVLGRNKVL